MATAKKFAAAAAGLTSRSSTVFEQRAFFHLYNLKATRSSDSHFNFLCSICCNIDTRAFTRVLSTTLHWPFWKETLRSRVAVTVRFSLGC